MNRYAWLDAIIEEQRRIHAAMGVTRAMLEDACEYMKTHNERDEPNEVTA